MPIEVSPERFDQLVDDALDQIPPSLASVVQNLVVLVEDEPPYDEPSDLLGLYDGIALTERDSHYAGALPDRILIFRGPLSDYCDSEEVRVTVVHEVAHHFGISDERLHELGWA